MRKLKVVLVGVAVGGVLMTMASPAAALNIPSQNCNVLATGWNDRTLTKKAGAASPQCESTRARLDKYQATYPTSYFGNWGSTSDTGVVVAGTWTGNFAAANGVSSWIRFR